MLKYEQKNFEGDHTMKAAISVTGKDAIDIIHKVSEKCAEAGAILSGNVIEVVGPKMDTQRWNGIRQALKRL